MLTKITAIKAVRDLASRPRKVTVTEDNSICIAPGYITLLEAKVLVEQIMEMGVERYKEDCKDSNNQLIGIKGE